MNPELEKFLQSERKRNRQITELKQAQARLQQLKNPDPKIAKAINDELTRLIQS